MLTLVSDLEVRLLGMIAPDQSNNGIPKPIDPMDSQIHKNKINQQDVDNLLSGLGF